MKSRCVLLHYAKQVYAPGLGIVASVHAREELGDDGVS
jgi:hypothetical protein